MSPIRFYFILSVILLTGIKNLHAQSIEAALNKHGEELVAEKAYVHFDKSAYAVGETIWFKAYLLEGSFPAEKTKTFYLDWLDEKGNVLYHSVCPVYESSATGQFDIPSDYKGNTIHVRGYTRWMLNFDTAFLYKKNIRVLTAAKTSVAAVKKITTIDFFPEGGDAIEAVANKIAFKATDQFGDPVSVKGIIETDKGRLVDSFRTIHDGMGSFYLVPAAVEKYVAKWKDEYGVMHTTSLPIIKSTGVNLKAGMEAGKYSFTLTRNEDATDNLKEGFVLGTMFQQMAFKAAFNLTESSSVKKNIPADQLPNGVLTITVFDKEARPVAERIIFINNNDYSVTPEIEMKRWGLSKRARNEIEISLPDHIVSNLSIAVTDFAIGVDSSENIFSTFLLTSDLKGYVHKPAYYFLNNSDSVKKHLDLVMLTNGWRRFNWSDLAKGEKPVIKYPKDTSYLSLSGKVQGVMPGTTSNETLIMIVKQKDSNSQVIMTPIGSDGRFNESEHIFFDTMTVYHQFNKNSLYKNAAIQYMTDRLPALFNSKTGNTVRYTSFLMDTAGNSYNYKNSMERLKAINHYQGKILENVTVRAKTKPVIDIMDEKYTSAFFSGGDGTRFDLVNDPMAFAQQNIFNYLQGRVAGLQISTAGGDVSMQWRGGEPQVFLDEMPTDVSMLSSIPVSDIAFVKVFRPPFMGGFGGGANGAIAIYTRRGDDFKNTPGKGLDRSTVFGYTAIREFYSPNYDVFDRKNEQADLRTTLYWNPMFLTSPGKSKNTITFYNTDITDAFRIIIEGITKEGQLVRFESVIE